MSIWSQKSASIQKRTSPLKFDHFRFKIPDFTASNLSTKVRWRSLNPVWDNFAANFFVYNPAMPLRIVVKDRDRLSRDDVLGRLQIPVGDLVVPPANPFRDESLEQG